MRVIRHIVLINWLESASRENIDAWIDLCQRIPQECPMVCNWASSNGVSLAEPANVSTHAFCISFDLRSTEEWADYLKHPFPSRVYSEGTKVIDLNRTASANMLVDCSTDRAVSMIRDGRV